MDLVGRGYSPEAEGEDYDDYMDWEGTTDAQKTFLQAMYVLDLKEKVCTETVHAGPPIGLHR